LEVYCKLEIHGNGNGTISCAPLLPVNLRSFPRIAPCHDLRALPEHMEPPLGMIMRWFNTVSNFNFSIEHRPGKKHANADALSRCAHAAEPDPDDKPDEIIAMMYEMINVLEPCVSDWDPAHIRF
jgi:hypothetical protein